MKPARKKFDRKFLIGTDDDQAAAVAAQAQKELISVSAWWRRAAALALTMAESREDRRVA